MVSYCSSSNDRSLTNSLIESSRNAQFECLYHFNNKPDWVDGLDLWSSIQNQKRNEFSKRYLDFDQAIGLYLPKSDQLNQGSTTTTLRISTNENLPLRLQNLIRRDQFKLDRSFSEKSLPLSTNEQLSISQDTISTSRTDQKYSNEKKTRYPLRQFPSRVSSDENQTKKENEQINREKYQTLLKEQISNIFSRETNSRRATIKIPSVQIRHENVPGRNTNNTSSTDPRVILERYTKLQQLLISPSPTQPTIIHKSVESRHSPILFQGISSFGLTVTPLDFSSSKQLNQSINEKNSSKDIQSEQANEQQTKRSFETHFLSTSSSNIFISSQSSNVNEAQLEFVRKYTRQHRPFQKHHFRRAKTFQFLPFIHGKHIDTNQNKD